MLELVRAGGWLMLPILACSVIALAIVAERYWTLRRSKIAPAHLVIEVWGAAKADALTPARITELRDGSALGRVLAAGLSARHLHRERVKENIEDVGRHVVHELERYLNTLGTIASITPLLGLLGTVIGMIKVFAVITYLCVSSAATSRPTQTRHQSEGHEEITITSTTYSAITHINALFVT